MWTPLVMHSFLLHLVVHQHVGFSHSAPWLLGEYHKLTLRRAQLLEGTRSPGTCRIERQALGLNGVDGRHQVGGGRRMAVRTFCTCSGVSSTDSPLVADDRLRSRSGSPNCDNPWMACTGPTFPKSSALLVLQSSEQRPWMVQTQLGQFALSA